MTGADADADTDEEEVIGAEDASQLDIAVFSEKGNDDISIIIY
jgi:hypothetical protein